MKKLLALVIAFFAATGVFADDAAEIRMMFDTINRLAVELKLQQILPYYTTDYKEVAASGNTIDYARLKAFADGIVVLDNPNAGARETFAALSGIVGRQLMTEEQLKRLEETGELDQIVASIRTSWKEQRAELQAKFGESFTGYRMLEVKVDGVKAVARAQEKSEGDRLVVLTHELVKIDGKWRIRKTTGKYLK